MTILRLASAGGAIAAALAIAACGGGNNTMSTTTGTGGKSSSTGPGATSSTGSATGGAGTGGAFEVAAHAAAPQVVNLGGSVIKSPKVQLIRYASDPHAAELDMFLQQLSKAQYWSETTSEYGVGPLTVLPTIIRPEAAPKTTTDNTLQDDIVANTSGASPAWGAADTDTIYINVMPPGTIINASGNCCTEFDGYHDEAPGGLVYAVVCACGGAFDGPGVSDIDQVTIAMSHELVEASTDPLPNSNTAFGQTDNADIIWTLVSGGELADMCEFNVDSFYVAPGFTSMVQTSWSNAAAKAGKDPCVPSPQTGPYFGATPVLADSINIPGVQAPTKGVKLAKGATTTIDVQLYSDGPLTGPFKVQVLDSTQFLGGSPELQLTLDKDTGSNGDTLKLTIKVLSVDAQLGVDSFFLLSQLGKDSSLTMGAVGN